jgi:hypothetical protein
MYRSVNETRWLSENQAFVKAVQQLFENHGYSVAEEDVIKMILKNIQV